MIRLFFNGVNNTLHLPLNNQTYNWSQFHAVLTITSKKIGESQIQDYESLEFTPKEFNIRTWVYETAKMFNLEIQIVSMLKDQNSTDIAAAIAALKPFQNAQIVWDCIQFLTNKNNIPLAYEAMYKFPNRKLDACKWLKETAEIGLKESKELLDEIWDA